MNSSLDILEMWNELSAADTGLVIESVSRFEEDVQAGNEPKLEDYIRNADPASPVGLVMLHQLIVSELNLRRHSTTSPRFSEYIKRFSGHEAIVKSAFTEANQDAKSELENTVLPPEGYGDWIPWDEQYPDKLVKFGGFGAVRIASHDQSFQRPAVIKIVKPEWQGTPENDVLMARLKREAEILGSLDHPAIPPAYGHGVLCQPAGVPYLAMRLVRGRTLAELLSDSSRLELSQLLSVVRTVADAIGYCHQRNIVHRDIKPKNVMVGEFNEVQVIDWGAAKRLDDDELVCLDMTTRERDFETEPAHITEQEHSTVSRASDATLGPVPGTTGYMSPEHARGDYHEMTAASDVFSIGSMLCEILTDKPAYWGPEASTREKNADVIEAFDRLDRWSRTDEGDAELALICRQCLAPIPSDRFANCVELAQRLEEYQAQVRQRHRDLELQRSEDLTRQEERRKRRPLWVVAVIAMLAVIGGGTAAWINDVRRQSDQLAGERHLNGSLTQVLDGVEGQLNSILREQRSSVAWAQLRDDPIAWNHRLQSAARGLNEASNIRRTSGFTSSNDSLERVAQLGAMLGNLRDDWKLCDVVTRIREGGLISSGDNRPADSYDRGDTNNLWTSRTFKRQGYQELLANHEMFDFAAQDWGDISQAISATRVPWLWVQICDDYALTLDKPGHRELRAKLRDIAIRIDKDPFANKIRSLEKSSFRKHDLETLTSSAKSRRQPFELISVLMIGLKLHAKPQEASMLIEKAAYQQNQDFWLWMGLNSEVADLEKRQIALTAALALHPESFAVHNELGANFLAQGDLSLARKDFVAASDDYSQADKHLQQSLTNAPDPISAIVYHNHGTLKEHLVELIQKKGEASVWATFRQKLAGTKQNKKITLLVDQAVECYEQAVQIDPALSSSWTNLGTIWDARGRIDLAEKCYRQALKVNTKNPRIWINLGHTLFNQAAMTEAAKCYRQAMQLDSRYPQPWASLGDIFKSRKEYRRAIESYDDAIERYKAHLDFGADHPQANYCRQQIATCERALVETK